MKQFFSLMACVFFLSGVLFGQTLFLAGSENGLYRISSGTATQIWNKSEVKKIIHSDSAWFFLTGEGIFYSKDLVLFEERNTGLPVKVLKIPENGSKRFTREIQELKDLEIHPSNTRIMVTATKDSVFLTKDGGLSWKSIGLNAVTTGAKAVAVTDLPDSSGNMQLTVFMSHPIYGISWKHPDKPGSQWADLNKGLKSVPSIRWPDEISDIAVALQNGESVIYASQTFMPNLYKLDWKAKAFTPIWEGSAPADTIEALAVTPKGIVFTAPGSLKEFSNNNTVQPLQDWNFQFSRAPLSLLCAWIPSAQTSGRGDLSLSELWLLQPEVIRSKFAYTADLKKGNYLPVHQVTSDSGFDGHLKTLSQNNLNMLVVDMKDDFGYLRYDAKDPLVLSKGRIGKGIALEPFVAKAKANNIYLVARIVVFKDKVLASYNNSKYAVWDKTESKAWQGYELVTKQIEATADEQSPGTEQVRKYYEEYWVDPYSEDVWEYNVAVAKELISRGFDEIQFDYIRFPTDGKNLSQASYRWQDPGMDKESALMSFLSHARSEITAPISIDIYGANGWYRTGARTGQDVELLARYVDVICPMFYPSHFEQSFLAQKPAEERPYRIFYYGSYRNTIIARNHVLVRPWAQAFYLNVSYDRTWYNGDYVQRQIFGIRDSVNRGYTYWNNSGRYADLRQDIGSEDAYPWQTPEAAFSKGKPIFGIR